MQMVLIWVLGWLIREVVVKFLVFTAVFALVALFVPYAIRYVAGFIDSSYLTAAFANIPAGVWYFMDFFRLDFGVPTTLSAIIARFLIRRLPVIG